MPFTVEEFFAVFARYNLAIWPLPVAMWVICAAISGLVILRWRGGGGAILLGLAAMWAVNGIGYHWLFFAPVNPAARVFAAGFALQAGLLIVAAMRSGAAEFTIGRDARSVAGVALIAYAAVAYPLLGLLAGHQWPAVPLLGVAPCPTTIFTIGVLLLGPWAMMRWLLIVPCLWSVVGGSAAILLRVPQDFGLIAAGLIAVAFALAHWRHMDVARHGSEAAPQAGSIPSQARGNAGAGGT